MNFEDARVNMIERQMRPWEVTDPGVCRLLTTVRREDFVPSAARELAFADVAIPLACGQAMLRPALEGRVLQALRIAYAGSVLEVGTGSGYFAALLAKRAKRVYSVEIEPQLAEQARNNLARAGADNVVVEEGDGAQGWFPQTPYDVIVVSGGLPELPEGLLAQIKPGGRLFAFVGAAPTMKACLVTRMDKKHLLRQDLFETVVPLLQQSSHSSTFLF
ncbi:MAG: protein-L-isoaspartate O-methyltransferase [Azoarcus sp.]|jgi:protein-L-isoaspartate(D-aspartate) O-methyltransferase|nr:protein-L-isoaspartate O-methyltransferase [Azoarcus sp.]